VSGPGETREGSGPAPATAFDLLDYIAGFLNRPKAAFLAILGEPGSGKSTLLRAVLPRVDALKAFVAYTSAPSATTDPGGEHRSNQEVAVLLIHPDWSRLPPGSAQGESSASSPLALAPADHRPAQSLARPLADVFAHMEGASRGVIVVDSWDRTTEELFRSWGGPESVEERFTSSLVSWATIQSAVLSSSLRFVLCTVAEQAAQMRSVADMVVILHEETFGGMRLRVASIPKVRGTPPPVPDHLYSLTGGSFRPFPALPRGFLPEVGPVDPDPDTNDESIWPGSTSYAAAFGRLRYGAVTGILLTADVPVRVPQTIAVPIAVATLRAGGRVGWIPAPSVRPSMILGLLRGLVPPDWMRDRLRILSAGREERGNAEFDRVILPLRREPGEAREHRPADAPGVGPTFPEMHRFLRYPPGPAPSVLILSLGGVRAAATAAGTSFDSASAPAVLGAYTRLPRFHLFGYGDSSDPAVPFVGPAVDTLLELGIAHGRAVMAGVRPKTAPFVLDWAESDGKYELAPAH
jgi:KaiC/GvpD/RAD55 family RecA-like ATPase